MSFSNLPPDVLRRVLKSLSLGNMKSDAIMDLLACERTCRAMRSAARDESVWHCVSLILYADDEDDVLDTKFAPAVHGHRTTQLYRQARQNIRLTQRSAHYLITEVFDDQPVHTLSAPRWRAWCSKLFLHFSKDDGIVQAGATLQLTQRAAELLACYAEDKLLRLMEACLLCSAHRQPDAFHRFELTERDVEVTEQMQCTLYGETSTRSRGTLSWDHRAHPPTTDVLQLNLPMPLHAAADRRTFTCIKVADDAVGKKLMLRIARRAGITRMSFRCMETFFERFQLIVAKVLVPAGLVLFESSRPKTALEMYLARADEAEFTDEDDDDDDGEEEEDSEDDDTTSQPPSYEGEDESDPFDCISSANMDAPGALVADSDTIHDFLNFNNSCNGRFYGFERGWANRQDDSNPPPDEELVSDDDDGDDSD